MKNDKRSGIFIGFTAAPLRCAVLLCFSAGNTIVPLMAFADVGLPPPAQHQSSGFPSEKALQQKGYDPKTGVWRVQSQNNSRPTVTKDGGTIKGTQGKTVTVTGKYGEKGVMHTTQTQGVNIGKVEKIAGGTLAALTAAGGAIGSDFAARAYLSAKNGDWGGAAREGLGAVLEGLSKLDITNFGNGVNQFLAKTGIRSNSSSGQLIQAAQQAATAQAQAEQSGNLGGAIANAAAKKAAEGAAKAAEGDKAYKEAKERSKKETVYQVVLGITHTVNGRQKSENKYIGAYTNKFAQNAGASYDKDGKKMVFRSSPLESYLPGSWSPNSIIYANLQVVSEITPPPETVTPQDMMLNQQDIKDILARMLNNQQTNHEELMNQLSRIGDAVEKSTESNQFTPMTADSAPYTPQGSNTPQQTRFTLNADGSVSTSIVPRPDLKPNSKLAPTRSEIVPNPNKGQDNTTIPTKPNNPESPNTPTTPNKPITPTEPTEQQGQNQANRQNENQQGLLCQVFPNIAACADLGESDYEDVQIPENPIDLGSLKPIDYFSTNGQCPAPASFQLGALGSFDFDYSYVCRVAETIRPIVILGTIIICSWMAYSAVKEL